MIFFLLFAKGGKIESPIIGKNGPLLPLYDSSKTQKIFTALFSLK
jgi:hypothetical protein